MFIRWLVTVFPREMSRAWQTMRPALAVWLVLSVALALLASVTTRTVSTDLALAQAAASLLVLVAIAWALDCSETGRALDMGELFSLYLRRVPALLGYGALAFGLCTAAKALTLIAVVMILGGSDGGLVAARGLSLVVYLTLLVRFCFFPFLVVLAERGDFATLISEAGGVARPAAQLAWPLFVSDRLAQGRRWRLLPYVMLISFAPGLVWSLSGQGTILGLAGAEMFAFMSYAGVFSYYRERTSELAGQ